MRKLMLLAAVVAVLIVGVTAVISRDGISKEIAYAQVCTVAPSGLVSWWPGDGNTNDIIDANGPSSQSGVSFVAGKVGQGITLASGGFIDIADNSNLQPTAFTIDAWVKPKAPSTSPDFVGDVVFQKAIGIGVEQVSYHLSWSSTDDKWQVLIGTDNTQNFHESTGTYAPDQFYHVAVTYDGGTLKLYVDGVLDSSLAIDEPILYSSEQAVIGANAKIFRDAGFPRSWQGVIDELEFFNVALTQSQIQAIFDADSAGKCKGPPVEPACSTEVRNTVNAVGKGAPFKKAPLVDGRVIMLAKDTVHTLLEVQNLLDAPAVWAAFDALAPADQPEDVFFKDSNGLATVESVTDDADGWAIYEDATGGAGHIGTVDGKTVSAGRTQIAVANTDCAEKKHIQWIGTVTAGSLNMMPARQQKITGSLLTILYPEEAVWDQGTQLYPFIFISDSDWTVDLCAEVPVGYDIVGAYDENGDLMTDSACAQTFVTGEVKVVAFDVVDIGSPEPVLGALLTVEHKGKVTEVDIEVPGVRSYVEPAAEEPAQLPTTGADPGSDSTPVWLAAAAFTGIAAFLLGSFVVWRRRRA